jgi:hypothetical protein
MPKQEDMSNMSKVDKIKADINKLSIKECAHLREWLSEKDREAAKPLYSFSFKSIKNLGFLYFLLERFFFLLKFPCSTREICYYISRKYTGQSDIKFGPVIKDSLAICFFLLIGVGIPIYLGFGENVFSCNLVFIIIGIYTITLVCQYEVNLLLFEAFRVNKLLPPIIKGSSSITVNNISKWNDLLLKIQSSEENPLTAKLEKDNHLEKFLTIDSKRLTNKMKEDIVSTFNAIKDDLTFYKNKVNEADLSSKVRHELDDLKEILGETEELKKNECDLSDSQKENIKWFNITILMILFPNILSKKRPWKRLYFIFKFFFRNRKYIKEYKLNSGRRRFILSVMSLWLLFVSYSLIYYALVPCSFEPYLYHHYWDALYFSIVTGTTLGFGDIEPLCLQAKFFSASQSLITLLFALIIVAKTLSLLPHHKSMQE